VDPLRSIHRQAVIFLRDIHSEGTGNSEGSSRFLVAMHREFQVRLIELGRMIFASQSMVFCGEILGRKPVLTPAAFRGAQSPLFHGPARWVFQIDQVLLFHDTAPIFFARPQAVSITGAP
jgi:hypothetical protein